MEQARQNRAAVTELLGRFTDMSRGQIADVLFDGNIRAANRVLLSLAKAGRLQRFALTPKGEYIYSHRKGPTGQTEHHLAIADVYRALVQTAVPGISLLAAANVQLARGLITDLLVVTGELVVFTEVHLGSNPFGTKLQRYAEYRAGRAWEKAPWWAPGKQIIVWIVAPQTALPWLERTATPHRETGMRVLVFALADAVRSPWSQLGYRPVLTWKLP